MSKVTDTRDLVGCVAAWRTALAVCLLWAVLLPAGAFDLQGHRGARGLAPENTLAAFTRALSLAVDTLELDLAVTAEDVLVISHDLRLSPALARDGAGRWLTAPGPFIRSLRLEELAAFDVGRTDPGSAYARAFPRQQAQDGERVPTLDALLQLLARRGDRHTRLNIEIKSDPRHPAWSAPPPHTAALLVRVLRDAGMLQRATVQAFDWQSLAAVHALEPDLRLSCLSTPASAADPAWTGGRRLADYDSVPAMAAAAGCSAWSPQFQGLDAGDIARAHGLGLAVWPWTVNRPADMRRMLDLGVDGFITDEPDLVLPLLAERGLRAAAAVPR